MDNASTSKTFDLYTSNKILHFVIRFFVELYRYLRFLYAFCRPNCGKDESKVIFTMKRKDMGLPHDMTPMLKARFGQPDDCADLVNKYGTYNIQPTSDTENLFPMIAPGLPEEWKRMAIGKSELENLQS